MQDNSAYLAIRGRNTSAYEAIYDIELILREIAGDSLETVHGEQWIKRALPNDIKEKITNALRYQEKLSWVSLEIYPPLYYTDLPDLTKRLLLANNWKEIFEDIFRNKLGIQAAMTEVEQIRNKVAHNRPISALELENLVVVREKIERSVPAALRARAVNNVVAMRNIDGEIIRISRAIKASLSSMETTTRIPTEELNSLDAIDSWWFAEHYLKSPTQFTERYAVLCRLYAAIPYGVGQAMALRSWVSDQDARACGQLAVNEMETIASRLRISND